MEEQEQIIKLGEKEEKLNSNKEYNEIPNEEDEDNNLLPKNNDRDNDEQKEENNKEALNSNNNNINTNSLINPEEKNEIKDENLMVGDYLITILYTKYLHIPYFIFGNIFNFYFPCKKFKSNQIYLSQMPTPPFGIVMTQCKNKILIHFLYR
jgi:hypothetical protein